MKVEKVFIDTEFFKGTGYVKRLQTILTTVITKAIKDRINEEITRCFKEKTAYSHWAQHVLPHRITMLLCRPSDDKLLRESGAENLQERINAALYNENYRGMDAPMILYFEILERYFLFKRVRDTGSRKNGDIIEMVFYESTPNQPDKRLQKIMGDVFKGSGMFAGG